MKKYLWMFVLLFVSTPALANTIGHAWSESVGWFDFSKVVVSDTGLSGYAYNDNTGWLSFATDTNVTNTNGDLEGHAWSESLGWFDFSQVTISNGTFEGYAYNDNTGWLNFIDGTVSTTWTPPAGTPTPTPEPERRSSSGSRRITPPSITQTPNNPSSPNATTPNPSQSQTPSQARNLKQGDSGNDVKALQVILNLLNYKISEKGPGSPGNETTLFGPLTQQALIRFQKDNNITPAIGYFGPITRDTIIKILISKLLTN